MRNSQIAARYARAFFEIGVEKQILNPLLEDLKTVYDVLTQNPEFKEVFNHPRIKIRDKQKIVEEVFKPVLKQQMSVNFLLLLLQKRRETEITEIYRQYVALYNDYKQQLPVEVRVAQQISQEQLKQMMERIAKITGKKPVAKVIVDESIMGGVVLSYGDKVIDGSVQSQLDQIAKRIKALPVAKMRGEMI